MKIITKKTTDLRGFDFNEGVVILMNKPIDWTSYKVVDKIKKILKTKKVGHAGTLDPLATGLLILCTGKMTKKIHEFQNLLKEYRGKIYFGKKTPTMDRESFNDSNGTNDISYLSLELIRETAKKFVGEIEQIPPVHSAVWINGKRAYELARKGKEVNLKPRKAFIESFEIFNYEPPLADFVVICSKGTYARSLANDLGDSLGCGAFLYELERTAIGEFRIEDAITVNELIRLSKESKN